MKESSWDTQTRINTLIDFITEPGNQQSAGEQNLQKSEEEPDPRNQTKANVCREMQRC